MPKLNIQISKRSGADKGNLRKFVMRQSVGGLYRTVLTDSVSSIGWPGEVAERKSPQEESGILLEADAGYFQAIPLHAFLPEKEIVRKCSKNCYPEKMLKLF